MFKKKTMILLLVASLSFGVLSGCAKNVSAPQADEDVEQNQDVNDKDEPKGKDKAGDDDFKYSVIDGGIRIDGYVGEEPVVIFPTKIEGKDVVMLQDNVFSINENIEVFILPDEPSKLLRIKEDTLSFVPNLEHILLGNGLVTVGSYSIRHNPKLKYLIFGDNIKTVEWNAITENPMLEMVYIPESVEYIGDNNFTDVSDNLVIHGEEGSYAEEYSKARGISFEIGRPCRLD